MTNPDNANNANDTVSSVDNALPPVDIDRVINAMTQFDITLEKAQGADTVATANLNGLSVMFAVLPSVIIVRADVGTDASFANADAGLFLAAGQINTVSFGARAVITEHEDQLIVRTEREFMHLAGMNDDQLAQSLKVAVDGVLAAQDALVAAAEEMAKLGSETAQDETGGSQA